jgi:hypothetical protein
MKKLFFGLMLAGAISLLIPLAASAAEYSAFVGCDDLAEDPVPSHVCLTDDFPAAYFEADEDTEYEVCVEFPSEEFLCEEEQLAEAGVLYLNSITTEEPGDHFVSWYVEEEEVASWDFRVDAPAPPAPNPPATVVPAPIVTPVPTIAPTPTATPTAACLKAKLRTRKLGSRLRKADDGPAKAKLRGKLRNARAVANTAC